jgi:hypothetical protein
MLYHRIIIVKLIIRIKAPHNFLCNNRQMLLLLSTNQETKICQGSLRLKQSQQIEIKNSYQIKYRVFRNSFSLIFTKLANCKVDRTTKSYNNLNNKTKIRFIFKKMIINSYIMISCCLQSHM